MRSQILTFAAMTAALFYAAAFFPTPTRADIIHANVGAVTGSKPVAPYPTTPTNLATWLGNGAPGAWISTFQSSSSNYAILNSITLSMGAASDPSGGFSVSLRNLVQSGGVTTLPLVEALAGSANPATAGSHTYTSAGTTVLAPGAGYVVLAEVAAGGGTYAWNVTSSGTAGLLIPDGVAGPSLPMPLDVNGNVVIFIPGGEGFILTVDATPVTLDTSLQMVGAQNQALLAGMQGLLGDLNGHLFHLRAGSGGEDEEEGTPSAALDDGVVLGQGDGKEPGAAARPLPRPRQWQVFTTVNYANVSLNAIGTQAGVDSHTWAPGVGFEKHLSRRFTLGLAASLLETHQTFREGLGELDIQGVALSAYGSYVKRAFWADLLYSFGRFHLDSRRNAPGLPGAEGSTTAFTNAVQLNAGWNLRFQNNTLVTGPFVGLDYLRLSVDGYNERGGGLGAATYGDSEVDSLISRVGWSMSKKIRTGFGSITPQARLSYERQYIGNNGGTTVNLINLPVTGNTGGESPGQDYLVAGAGMSFQFNDRLSLLLTYQGQFFRQNLQAHFGGLNLSWAF